jgi:hypothetical protein
MAKKKKFVPLPDLIITPDEPKFLDVPYEVIHSEELTDEEKVVWMKFAISCMEDIHSEMNQKDREWQVKGILDSIAEKGFIETFYFEDGEGRTRKVYYVNIAFPTHRLNDEEMENIGQTYGYKLRRER